MWRVLLAMKQNLHNMTKSPKVADETMFGDGDGAERPAFRRRSPSGWTGVSAIRSIVRAPLSLLSCLSHPPINGADGVWVSSELVRVSEMNHLIVNDSLRYAILM
ncbi:hypothetical protein U1Q18_024432 [Sarracenia purpurea var. burkii]